MKPAFILALSIVLATSCKPQKPWSPHDKAADTDSPATASTATQAGAGGASADIGDLEQAVFLSGSLSTDSKIDSVTTNDIVDRNKNITKSEITVAPPLPKSLWVEYMLRSNRTFPGTPGVLRARVMVNDKVAGTITAVFGANAKRKGDIVKFDLLEPFGGNVPDSFLAKVEGDLYLMPEGTDESTLDPNTATSEAHSNALYATVFRVDVVQPTASAEGTGPAQSPLPAPEAAAPAPAQ